MNKTLKVSVIATIQRAMRFARPVVQWLSDCRMNAVGRNINSAHDNIDNMACENSTYPIRVFLENGINKPA
jgi:hypothetical protein